MTVTINMPSFEREMQGLMDKVKRRAVRSAAGSASEMLRDHVKAQSQSALPVSKRMHMLAGKRRVMPGYMKSQIFHYWKSRGKPGSEVFIISVRGGRSARKTKAGLQDAYYWRWVHEGHNPRQKGGEVKGGRRLKAVRRDQIRKKGGFVKGAPFLLTGFRTGAPRALDEFNRRFSEELAKAQR